MNFWPCAFTGNVELSTNELVKKKASTIAENGRTMSRKGMPSFSGEMIVLWIKNLSLHAADAGGSSLFASSVTER